MSNNDISNKVCQKNEPNGSNRNSMSFFLRKSFLTSTNKSKSFKNILNQNCNKGVVHCIKSNKSLNFYNLRNKNFLKTFGDGFKIFKLPNFKNEKIDFENEYMKNNTNYIIDKNLFKKDVEKILLSKIEEINEEIEKNENTFIYNQKLMKKKLEEKEKEIKMLKNDINIQKNKKIEEYERIIKEYTENFMNNTTELNLEIQNLRIENKKLKEKNFENEKIIKKLENKNKKSLEK